LGIEQRLRGQGTADGENETLCQRATHFVFSITAVTLDVLAFSLPFSILA